MKTIALLFALAVASVGAERMSAKSIERVLKSGSKSGSGSGDGGNPCDLCNDGRPDSITFKYLPSDPSNHAFEKHTCIDYVYPTTATITVKDKSSSVLGTFTVTEGDEFTVNGAFDADSFFQFAGTSGLDDGGDTCIVHTSCSDELLPGYENRIGPFELIGPECIPTECVICDSDNKNRPDLLTMIYTAAGANSMYQPIDKADCVAGTYPSPADIRVVDKDGTLLETFTNVQDGDQIVIGNGYTLEAETHFEISGFGSCFIHTSCSVPLVPLDQIGPWLIIEGNDCGPPPADKCIKPDSEAYACGDTITIDFDLTVTDPSNPGTPFAALRDDWIGIYPCSVPIDAFNHAEVWEWTCGSIPAPANTACVPTSTGVITFDSLPSYNQNGPHAWPVAPYVIPATGEVNRCFRAVLLRNDGPSVPPYVSMCESVEFTITENGSAGCAIRPNGSPSQPESENASAP